MRLACTRSIRRTTSTTNGCYKSIFSTSHGSTLNICEVEREHLYFILNVCSVL